MPVAIETGVFFICICFGVCGILWMYGDFAVRGEPGGIGLLKSVLFSVLIPALATSAAIATLGYDDNDLMVGVAWAVGLIIGIAIRLGTRPAYVGPQT